MQIARNESGRVLMLSGMLRINEAEALHTALLEYIWSVSRPVLDLSEVAQCDTAALQLLYSAELTAKRLAKSCEMVGLPAAVLEIIAALGVAVPGSAVQERANGI